VAASSDFRVLPAAASLVLAWVDVEVPMKTIPAPRIFSLVLTAAALVGCGGSVSSMPRTSAVVPHAMGGGPRSEAASPMQGKWVMTQTGDQLVAHEQLPMKIEINGSHVLGTYAADKGKIDGELQGNVIEGSWEETDGNGNFRWVLAPDGKTFRGTFSGMLHSQRVPEGATWSGTRESSGTPSQSSSSPRPPR
jgi:hypothetical protein